MLKNYATGFQPMSVLIFDRSRRLSYHWASCEGNMDREGRMSKLPANNPLTQDTTYRLKQFLTVTQTLQGDNTISQRRDLSKHTGYTAVIFVAEYTGRPGRKFRDEALEYLRSRKDLDVQFLLVYTSDVRE